MNPVDALLIGTILGLIIAALVYLVWSYGARLDAKREELLERIEARKPQHRRRADLSNLEPAPEPVHLTGSPRMAVFVDGPLAGAPIHEVWAPGGVLPNVIAFPIAEGDPARHFYRLDADGGLRYLRTEPEPVE